VHWLAYPATILGAVHFVMLAKGWQIEPLVYLGAILAAARGADSRQAARGAGLKGRVEGAEGP
jgi:methionine sulfoxide reductase heme-binding subunit